MKIDVAKIGALTLIVVTAVTVLLAVGAPIFGRSVSELGEDIVKQLLSFVIGISAGIGVGAVPKVMQSLGIKE